MRRSDPFRLTEAQWQTQVVNLAHLHGWMIAHFRPAPTRRGGYATPVGVDAKGFPDLVLARRGAVMFRELKTDTGKLTPEQEQWGIMLGESFDVWRPADIDRVARELR